MFTKGAKNVLPPLDRFAGDWFGVKASWALRNGWDCQPPE